MVFPFLCTSNRNEKKTFFQHAYQPTNTKEKKKFNFDCANETVKQTNAK